MTKKIYCKLFSNSEYCTIGKKCTKCAYAFQYDAFKALKSKRRKNLKNRLAVSVTTAKLSRGASHTTSVALPFATAKGVLLIP